MLYIHMSQTRGHLINRKHFGKNCRQYRDVLINHCSLLGSAGSHPRALDKKGRCSKVLNEASYQDDTLFDLTYKRGCMPEGWERFFKQAKPLVKVISDELKKQTDGGEDIGPKIGWVFRAFQMVPPDDVRVIIMGQDPAPEPGEATGLAFSLKPRMPSYEVPSVQRVVLEAGNEGYCVNDTRGNLIPWARQGVLLLNTALTLITNDIGSHLDLWQNFTDAAISFINTNAQPSTWILWGYHAKSLFYDGEIDTKKHYVLMGGHPSPRADSKKFFCGNYFHCASKWLKEKGRGEVNWNLGLPPCENNGSYVYGRVKEYPGYYVEEACTQTECWGDDWRVANPQSGRG